MIDEQLAEIKARCEAATPGPWAVGANNPYRDRSAIYQTPDAQKVNPLRWQVAAICREVRQCDSDFIAHARTDIPALLAEVERLRTYIRIAQEHMSPSALAYLARMNEE